MYKPNVIAGLTKSFALRIIKLYKHLIEEQHEYVMSKQVYRCGTSIGANVAESRNAQSTADFINKLSIALKEADENGIKGKDTTPFLLDKVQKLTQGKSLEANIRLVFNNAKLASKIAIEYSKLA